MPLFCFDPISISGLLLMWRVMLSRISSHIQNIPLSSTPTRLMSMLILSFDVWNVYLPIDIRLTINRYGNWTQKGEPLPSQLCDLNIEDLLTSYSPGHSCIRERIGRIISAKRALVLCLIMPTRRPRDLVTFVYTMIRVITFVILKESYDASRYISQM